MNNKSFSITSKRKRIIFVRKGLLYTSIAYPFLGIIYRPETGSLTLNLGLLILILHAISILIFLNINRYNISGKLRLAADKITINNTVCKTSTIKKIEIVFKSIKGDITEYPTLHILQLEKKDGGDNQFYMQTLDEEYRFTFLLDKDYQLGQIKEFLRKYNEQGIEVVFNNIKKTNVV